MKVITKEEEQMSKKEIDTYVNLRVFNAKEILPTFFGIAVNKQEVVKYTFGYYQIDDLVKIFGEEYK